jgi:hypothetical protein
MGQLIEELPGDSGAIQLVRANIAMASRTNSTVLLTGESGSGKEFVARLIHQLSDRRDQPFVAVNFAGMPFGLISTGLVGYTKGAFTGAIRDRPGLVQSAHKGTILLDDIGETNLDLQALLLSLVEDSSVRPLGTDQARTFDVRFIAATNRDLAAMLKTGSFRADLYYRLAFIHINIPPLRERPADIPALATQLLAKISKRQRRQLVLTPDAVTALRSYVFPGNVRELASLLERAAMLEPGASINAKALQLPIISPRRRRIQAKPELEQARRQIELLQREIDGLRIRSITAQPIWQGRGFPVQHDYCFVLMPFGDARDLHTVYHDHMKPLIEKCGLRCERADDIYDVSGVMQSVWEGINKARIVVADLTDRNPNVFYELGIAHRLGKPVIMLSQLIDFVPFDRRHLRCILYSYTPRGVTQLEHALERTIKTILSTTTDLGP